jgi:hypothetical protein
MLSTPLTFDFIFDRFLAFTSRELRKFIAEYTYIVDTRFRLLDRSIYYFFDRVDQALNHSDDKIWVSIQKGLLEAAWDTKRSNTHVKIYLSVRQEAYAELLTYNRGSMDHEVSVIKYQDGELKNLINHLLEHYENKKTFEEFLGITYFHNVTTNTQERIFSFMNRYSLGRPRDFVIFCGHMTDCLSVKKSLLSKRLKQSVIESSSNSIISSLHSELRMLMSCLKSIELFDSFVELLDYNILKYTDLKNICKQFHDKHDKSGEPCCDDCKN